MSATNSRVLLLGSENADGTVTGVTAGTSQPIYAANDSGIRSFFFTSVGTTSGGTILIEEADWAEKTGPYSGTWSQIASIAASSFTGGAQLAYHVGDSAYAYVRVRISSAITGGGAILATTRTRSSF